ncbi:MAG: NAD-dependent deacylase [Candidatus Krumholzibacteria bacterium]|nr:NAD-dependent deacylase [Candidatus Krumholzibacteria bacterium]
MDNKNFKNKEIEEAAARIAASSRLVVSTGAGISKESGISTFRDADGLWNNYRPEQLASREGFLANPGMVWKWYRERLLTAKEHDPNPGHYALARLEEILPWMLLVTQNVDNLHRRAGSRQIVELHGNIERYRCLEHSHPAELDPEWGDDPPICHCGSMIRPDVVWFGEQLPQAELETAFNESARCDVFMIVGTSGLVQPAASLPQIASSAGAYVIEVNVEESAVTHWSDLFIEGRSGEVLPLIAAETERILDLNLSK